MTKTAGGGFVVVWHSPGQDGNGYGVFGQRFSSTGGVLGTEFQVNTYTTSYQLDPAVSEDGAGGFVVVWHSDGQDGSAGGIVGQRYSGSGNAVCGEFQINTYTTDIQELARVAPDGNGNVVVVWDSFQQDGSGAAVVGQRLAATLCGNGTVDLGEECDSAISTPADGCECCKFLCPPTVDGTCTTGFGKGSLLINERVSGKEKLVAKLLKGPLVSQTDFGNPLGARGTTYSLCIYDDGGARVGQAHVSRAGEVCGGGSNCWKSIGAVPPGGTGFTYKDTDLSADGVFKIKLKAGSAGHSKSLVKGRGSNLPPGIPAALQSTTNVTVQLRASDGQCFSTTLGTIKKSDPDFFKAK